MHKWGEPTNQPTTDVMDEHERMLRAQARDYAATHVITDFHLLRCHSRMRMVPQLLQCCALQATSTNR